MHYPSSRAVAFVPSQPFAEFCYEFLFGDVWMLGSDAIGADADARVAHVHAYGYFGFGRQLPQLLPVLVHA
jgi:hypothetical protein